MAVEEIGVKLVTEGEKAVQKAFDSCETALKSLEKATDKYVGAANDQEAATSNVEKAIRGARSTIGNFDKDIIIAGKNMGSFADAASAMGLSLPATPMAAFGQGIKAVADFLINATKETIAYATQVRDLGRISGATAEDTSRLIQVADDLKVEYGVLEQAAKKLAQEGIALTAEELAKASDEYLSIVDAGGRAEYAVEKFGRAGLEMTKILEMGGEALRQLAKDQKDSMILTQEQVDAARELEKAQDELDDTLQGLSYTIGNKVIPVWNDFLRSVNDLFNLVPNVSKGFKEQMTQIAKNASSFEDFKNQLFRVGVAYDDLGDDAEKAYEQLKNGTEEAIDSNKDYEVSIKKVLSSQRLLPDAIQATTDRMYEQVQAQLDAAKAAEQVKIDQQKLTTFMGGAMGRENANYQKSLQAQEKSLGDIQRRMRELLAIPKWTADQQKEYDGLLSKQDEEKAKIEEIKEAHKLATKKIIFDLLAMQLAVGGLTKAESDFLIQTAKDWGLIDQATVDAWKEAETYAAKIQDPAQKAVESLSGSLDTAIGKTGNLDSKLRNLPDREITVTVYERTYKSAEFGEEPGPAAPIPTTKKEPVIGGRKATGGSVQAGQPYLVGERGPELIVPDLSGMVMPNHMVSSLLNMMRAPSAVYNTTTINYNLGVTTMNSPQAVQRSFAMMQLLAG